MSERWPILDYPGRGRAVIEPGPLLAHKQRVPVGCVLCFFRELFALAVAACRRLDRSSQGNSRAKG